MAAKLEKADKDREKKKNRADEAEKEKEQLKKQVEDLRGTVGRLEAKVAEVRVKDKEEDERWGDLRQRLDAHVAEAVLGYGLFPGSEIAQRHAYLLTFIWTVRMLEEGEPIVKAMVKRHPVLGDWLEQRRQLLEPPTNPRDPTARVRFSQARSRLRASPASPRHRLPSSSCTTFVRPFFRAVRSRSLRSPSTEARKAFSVPNVPSLPPA